MTRPPTCDVIHVADGTALVVVDAITLPQGLGETECLLNCLVRDWRGVSYVSNELGHTVLALDSRGEVLWRTDGKGNSTGRFWCPRGMALGYLKRGERFLECLAVSDAWNHRVQFLDLEGVYVGAWTTAGERAFNEVSDVRCLQSVRGAADAVWLVLDRGNHRLCGIDVTGRLVSELGRAFSPVHESDWTVNAFSRVPRREGREAASGTFDPLHYPLRILGTEPTNLLVFEPTPGRLKQPILGNLFIVASGAPQYLEWLNADSELLLGWDASESSVVWCSAFGSVVCRAAMPGRPVPSAGPASEVWMHSGDTLRLWRLQKVDEGQARIPPFAALRASLREELERIAGGESREMLRRPVEAVAESIGRLRSLAGRVGAQSECGCTDIGEAAGYVRSDPACALAGIESDAGPLMRAALALGLLGATGRVEDPGGPPGSLYSLFERSLAPVLDSIRCAIETMEMAFQTGLGLRESATAADEAGQALLWTGIWDLHGLAAGMLASCGGEGRASSTCEAPDDAVIGLADRANQRWLWSCPASLRRPVIQSTEVVALGKHLGLQFRSFVIRAHGCPNPPSLESTVRWLINRDRDYRTAAGILERLRGLEPQNGNWMYLLAVCLHYPGDDVPRALELYDRAAAAGASGFWIAFNKAVLHYQCGRRAQALENVHRALAAVPGHPEAASLLKLVEEMRFDSDSPESGPTVDGGRSGGSR